MLFFGCFQEARNYLQETLHEKPVREDAFYRFLMFWAEINEQPLALFLDEIDGLDEHTLISVLKQFRTGYTNRPKHFPQSICLIGVRDLQDYRLQSIEDEEKGILISPFNIIAESVLLRDFTEDQVKELYNQHTKETGQIFTEEAVFYAYYLTQGQPWLVNAIAYQACFRDVIDRSQPITKETIEHAKEQLILRRETHISSLTERLKDSRVRPIIDAIITSFSDPSPLDPANLQYVRDLGIIKEDRLEIANPLYEQIIPRALAYTIQRLLTSYQTSAYLDEKGRFNMNRVLKDFTKWFRENVPF